MANFREIHQDPVGEGSTQRILELFDTCFEGHSECALKNLKNLSYPPRLINIGEEQDLPRLQVLDKNERSLYIGLSHCWGKKQTYQTTLNTLPERLEALDWDAMPKTYQDAIKVARLIGVKFIWIDSICIVQNDP